MNTRSLAPLMITLTLLLSIFMVSFTYRGADGARSGDFPVNRRIQDYEPSADEQWDLDVASDSEGRLYAVWADNRDLVPEIRFSKSLNGSTWGDGEVNNNDIVVSDGPKTDERVDHPSIAVDEEGTLYCIWVDDRSGDPRIRITTSLNSGGTWNSSRIISEITGTVSMPYIRYSAQTGILSIVYVLEHIPDNATISNKDVMYTYSTDNGDTFSTPVMVNDDGGDEDQIFPRMDISDEGKVIIVWQDYRNGDSSTGSNSDVYFAFSENGKDIGPSKRAHDDPEIRKQEQPDTSFSESGDLMVVWQETSIDGWEVMYSMAWSGSDLWDGNFLETRSAVAGNLSRKDQFMPRVGYTDGSFLLSWTELDLRNFYLIRAGYISRYGGMVMDDHIVDDSIDWGMFINDPIYHAEMYRETVSVIGTGEKGHIFWMDFRTDPVPADDLTEDGDPYTAVAFPSKDAPQDPKPLGIKLADKDWDTIKIKWPVSPDAGFKGYYINYGSENTPVPDENINDFAITDRTENSLVIDGLEPDTEYEIRMIVKDIRGRIAQSPLFKATTEPNNPPSFEFIEPDGIGDNTDKFYEIRWTVSDREERAEYTLHYDDDLNDPVDQVFLYSGNTEDDTGERSFVWNTSALPSGGYTINATVDDGVNDPVTIYSSAIIVSHPYIVRDHPTVSFITIEGGKENAYVDAVLDITFDTPIASTSIDESSIFVLDDLNTKVPGILSVVSSEKITWRPSSRMKFDTQHMIQILPSVTDLDGNELDGEGLGIPSPFSLIFNTRSEEGPPEVRDRYPQGQNVAPWTEIWVKFDRPLDTDKIGSSNIKLTEGSSGAMVPITMVFIEDDLLLEITLQRPLVSNVTYTMNLSGLASRTGYDMDPFEWSFTAGEPSLDIDTDNDGVPDDLDWFREDPNESTDTDLDGKGDNTDTDDDGDGMPDTWELEWGFDPLDDSDADDDPDGDGKSNLDEFRDGTTPVKEDSADVDYSLIIFIFVAIAVLIILGMMAYSILQRKKIDEGRMEKGFFMEDEDYEE